MPQPTPPLNDSHYTEINRQLRELAQLESEIAVAQQAGVDCNDRSTACSHLKEKLQQLKNAYFPTKP